MPEQMADAAISLGGAMLFAWLACAFAQFAAFVPVRSKPSCACKVEPPRNVLLSLSFALLATAMPGILAALFAASAVDVAAAESGALIGLWLAARSDFTRWARAIAALGCVLGLATMSASAAGMLLLPVHSAATRLALYLCAILAALAFGAAATAFRFARDMRTIARYRISPSRVERVLYLLALALIVVLGAGIELASASKEFDVSALGAACMLAAALGVCLMGGARHSWRASGARITRAPLDTTKRSVSAAAWVRVSDAWLVAACGPAAHEPANFDDWIAVYQPPAQTLQKIHHASRDSPRRRRRMVRRVSAND